MTPQATAPITPDYTFRLFARISLTTVQPQYLMLNQQSLRVLLRADENDPANVPPQQQQQRAPQVVQPVSGSNVKSLKGARSSGRWPGVLPAGTVCAVCVAWPAPLIVALLCCLRTAQNCKILNVCNADCWYGGRVGVVIHCTATWWVMAGWWRADC